MTDHHLDERLGRIEGQIGKLEAQLSDVVDCLHGSKDSPGVWELVRRKSETSADAKRSIDGLSTRVYELESWRTKVVAWCAAASAIVVAAWEVAKEFWNK